MLRRRHVFTVEQLGSRDGASKDLAPGCVVPGVTSTYRRIPDAAYGCSLDFRKREGELRRLGRQMPLFKLASQDSGMEMVVGDSPLAILPGLSQDSLNLEPMGSPELSAQRGRLLASRKLEQVLERSRRLPRLPGQRHSLQLPIKTECGVSFCAAGGQGSTEAENKLEAGLEVTEVVEGMAPGAWACLPGQGLRYLEHLCLVLEQMARLQQFYLQLQTERSHGGPEVERSDVAPSPSPLQASGNGVQEARELLSQTKETGEEAVSASNVGKLGANPPRLPEVPMEPTHSFSPSQGYKDLSHWDKVKVLLNRIRWRSSRHSEHPAPPDRSTPMIESRHLSERPPYHPPQNTFIPSLVVKKSRAKNLSVC